MRDDYDENNWRRDGPTIHMDLTNFVDTKKFIEEKIQEEKRFKGTDENLQMIEQYLEEVNNEIVPLAEEINQKTRHYALPVEESYNQESNQNVPQGNLEIQELANNEEILQERRKQLEKIHQTSAQIKDMSDKMVQQLNDQGAILDDVEGKVITAEDNAKKAKQEITKANELSKGNKKKMLCFIAIIVVAILGITAILLSLLL